MDTREQTAVLALILHLKKKKNLISVCSLSMWLPHWNTSETARMNHDWLTKGKHQFKLPLNILKTKEHFPGDATCGQQKRKYILVVNSKTSNYQNIM